MAEVPKFDEAVLRKICDILGDTYTGLTGSEIGQLLQNCGIDDPFPGETKRRRLFEALSRRQKQDRCGNNVVAFIYAAMNPVRYVGNRELFEERRSLLNEVFAFAGYTLGEDGKLRKIEKAHTLSEAQERASRLRKELIARKVHPDVLRFCRAELLQDNYFHAVFEAAKSVADKIREKTGLTSDGAKLVDEAFGGKKPLLAFNTLQTETERSEHTGLMNLMKGLFGVFRNTTAHAPKIKWSISEQDALDMLTLTSLIHRRLDQAVLTRSQRENAMNA
ncbi:TIGR02391 family protein [Thermodesulfatator atlanticus]|uniref:TIGR02391 family protein n=1 Tax=Thermodesulfatator atlanticus TaxID=501497 RepID=UPI0003B442BF|nr:TIGR02391 family protein [Thermodesulfatator atlanticus]